MKSLARGIGYYIVADSPSFNRTQTGITEPLLVEFMNYVTNYHQELPWIWTLEPQIPVDCFEALKKGERILDPKNIAAVCELLATTYGNWWILDEDENEVKDTEGNDWKVIDFWHHASGWVEAKLQPSDLRELLNEREDSTSEKRLRTYFFGDEVWIELPEIIKSSLISADRDWFSGTVARKEAVLNELKEKPELREKILKGSERKHKIEQMGDGIVYVLWQGILIGKLEELIYELDNLKEEPVEADKEKEIPKMLKDEIASTIRAVASSEETTEIIFGKSNPMSVPISAQADEAKAVIKICTEVCDTLCRRDNVKSVIDEFKTMKKSRNHLEKRLDPIFLRPWILNSPKCELCPA